MLTRIAKFLTHQMITRKMAISEIDVHRSANGLIGQFGADAKKEAANRAAQHRDAHDEEGAALWVKIGDAVDLLLRAPAGPLN